MTTLLFSRRRRSSSSSFSAVLSFFLLFCSCSLFASAKSADNNDKRKPGVIPWAKIETEKNVTIYGAYDATKTIKFEFKSDEGHDVYRVRDVDAFKNCSLDGEEKLPEVRIESSRDALFAY